MSVSGSAPGVFVEEVPSGSRAISGVPTSIAAFVGYTSRGPVDEATRVFSFADFEQSFGGLDLDSDLSYAVNHFFLNGGGSAWVVRIAEGALASSVRLEAQNGSVTLIAEAASEGIWGNSLIVSIDYATADPVNTFNLTVRELGEHNGRLVALRTETHRNLSMNDQTHTFAVDTVNASSDLISLTDGGLAGGVNASSTGAFALTNADVLALNTDKRRLSVSLDGGLTTEIQLIDDANDLSTVAELATRLRERINAIDGVAPVTVSQADNLVTVMSGTFGRRSSIFIHDAATQNAAAALGFGMANGGREITGARETRPVANGTMGDRIPDISAAGIALNDAITVELVNLDGAGAVSGPVISSLTTQLNPIPTTLGEARSQIQAGLAAGSEPAFTDAMVDVVDNALVVVPSQISLPGQAFSFSGAGAAPLGLTGGAAAPDNTFIRNLAAYQLGAGLSAGSQQAGTVGSDGTPPVADATFIGNRTAKTGTFALEDADIFNILLYPGVTSIPVLAAGVSYAEERRSMVIVDIDRRVDTVDEARDWVTDGANTLLRSSNVVAYFPRIRMSDPLQSDRPRSFPNSGLMAGIWARTDAARGVWKAPAGREASLRGVQALDYVLTASENRLLHPLGLNCIRTFPDHGKFVWGARTLVGADARTSEWKYIPVRRTALYIEESLYRGTQFAVFEPNDEPLWAEVRLAVGSFMQNLFRQGGLQGSTPREAFFVRCDNSTTTQADIDQGILNFQVGFAPLKPAEFVVISIQQIAGQSQA